MSTLFSLQTNNAQEGFNLAVKRDHTLRERLPTDEFKIESFKMVESISSRYDDAKMKLEGREVKKIIDLPVISIAQYREAHEWMTDEKMIIVEIEHSEVLRRFLTPTPKFIEPTIAKISEVHKKKFDTFEEYKNYGHKMVYDTKICLNDCFLNSTCTCSQFIKSFMCKHIIGFCIQLKLKTCPKEANSKPIGTRKRGAGRTSRAKSALVRQTT